MLKNYFLLAVRNIIKHKTTSLINIIGLAVGLTVCLLITKHVQYEFSYDKSFKNADNIYRIIIPVEKYKYVTSDTPLPVGPAIKRLLPDFSKVARVSGLRKLNSIEYHGKIFKETGIRIAEPDILDIFSIELIKGDRTTALSLPNSIIINQEIADKYFGNEDPIDKVIKIADMDFIVKGVMINLPENSTFKWRAFIPYPVFEKSYSRFEDDWVNRFCETYLLANSPLSARELKSKIYNALIDNFNYDAKGEGVSIQLQSISRIHLFSQIDFGIKDEEGDYDTLLIYGLFAAFILLIACINFINLSIGQLTGRFKEVGIRKLLGAGKRNILFQFWGEIILLCSIAFILSIALCILLQPYFNQIIGGKMPNTITAGNIIFFLLIFLLSCLIAGLIPSFLFSRYQSAEIFRGKIKLGSSNLLSRILITVQYSLSIFFIICASIINKQVNHIFELHKINDNERVVIVNFDSLLRDNDTLKTLKQIYFDEIKKYNLIKCSIQNAGGIGSCPIEFGGKTFTGTFAGEDADYFKMFNLRIIEGRNFDYKKFPADSLNSVIVNESFVKENNVVNPIGKTIKRFGKEFTIVGVVEDYIYTLKQKTFAVIYTSIYYNIASISCKVDKENLSKVLPFLEAKWKEIFPFSIYRYSFLDDNFIERYSRELAGQKVINLVSFLTLFISCIGVLGLTTLSISRRTKEIGIRKVLGASAARIIMLLTKDMILLILISSVIAAPAAYFYMRNWLNDFFYRIDITATVFIFSTLLTIGITLIIVGAKTAKTALINPVDSLRYE